MKKLIVTAFTLVSCGIVYALPVGNPAEASLLTWGVVFPAKATCNSQDPCTYWFDAWALKMGYYGDYVFNRHLELDQDELEQGQDINTTRIFTNAGYLALNICNKLDLFGTLGASKISITTNEISWFLAGNAEGRLDWQTFFSWSAGARATIFSLNHFIIGVESQYFQTSPDLSNYVSFSNGMYTYFNEENKMIYREWQVGAGLSYSLTCFCPNISVIPYAAIKWGWVSFHTDDFKFVKAGTTDLLTIFNLRADKVWGYAIGTSVTICDMVDITAEGRFADEKAFYINGNFRF
jgi:major outer membrane protein